MTDPVESFPRIVRPEPGRERPLVISVPHSGTVVPDDERDLYRIDVERLLHDGDLYVDRLYEGAQACGATVISSPWSRFVIDLNRLPDDVSPRSVEGGRRRRADGYYGDRGIIWAVTTHNEPIYRGPLPRDRFERRRDRYYTPYHDALARELARLRATFGHAILLDAHSMPSRATRLHSDPGQLRPDIVPGTLDGASCGAWLADAVGSYWDNAGYTVRFDAPYRGGGITRRHADPEAGVHAIQVELNRALYMDERTLEPADGFERLHADCLEFADTLARLTQ